MREILFRGKREFNEWVEGSLIIWEDGSCSIEPGNLTEPMASVNPETVGQFTGLTDKEGKKIFEGDIIAFTCNDGTQHFSVVEYGVFNCSCCHGVYGWYLDGDCGDIRDLDPEEGTIKHITIAGNIYDNPELLEKK